MEDSCHQTDDPRTCRINPRTYDGKDDPDTCACTATGGESSTYPHNTNSDLPWNCSISSAQNSDTTYPTTFTATTMATVTTDFQTPINPSRRIR
jgi:hypothetical protein